MFYWVHASITAPNSFAIPKSILLKVNKWLNAIANSFLQRRLTNWKFNISFSFQLVPSFKRSRLNLVCKNKFTICPLRNCNSSKLPIQTRERRNVLINRKCQLRMCAKNRVLQQMTNLLSIFVCICLMLWGGIHVIRVFALVEPFKLNQMWQEKKGKEIKI